MVSDEELPFLTPYDAFVNEREAHQSIQSPTKISAGQSIGTQSPSKLPSSQLPQNLGNLNLSYNISDEKLLTAAAQLVDVYNKRSKASAIITVQPKTVAEPSRNRGTNIRKQGSRSQFPLPVSNFVVTKITEKSPNTVLNKNNSIKLTKTDTQSSDDMNPNRCKQEEIEHTKRLAEVQRQKSLQIFNTYAPKSVKNLDGARQKLVQTKSILNDGKKIQIKNIEMTTKNAPSAEFFERSKVMPSTSKAQLSKTIEASKSIKNEPVILNFRTKIHDQLAGPSKQSVTLPKNGQTNSGAYRMLEITPLSKNVMAKSTLSTKQSDRSVASKSSQSNHTKYSSKAVRPQQAMSVTRVYSRYPLNNTSRSTYYNSSMIQRARAPIPKKYPSMSDLTQKQTKNRLRAFELSKTFKRSNSCVALGDKNNPKFFDHILTHSKEGDKLYDLCSAVVNKLAYKTPIVTPRRKRGRPRKKVYASFTRELLNSADFSLREDIWRLHQHPFGDRHLNSSRHKRFALLSIEPILPDISELNICKGREHSPVSSFQTNRVPLKTYSRANLIQPRATLDSKRQVYFDNFTERKSQIQLLNIEPLSSSSQIDIIECKHHEEVSQSTEYIDENFLNTYEYDLSDAIYVEYLDENDEIESPAYEPHTSDSIVKPIAIITGEADTTVENYNQQSQQQQEESLLQQHQQQQPSPQQQLIWDRDGNRFKKSITHNFTATRLLNEKGSPHIEIKYLHTNESDAHSTTDSITEIFPICEREEDTGLTVLPHILPKQKAESHLSPTRKSTRKRKIPNEFPNFAKKVRS